jgi:hypothetical protein
MRLMRKKRRENTDFIRELNVKNVNIARIVQKEKMEFDI